MNKIIKTALFNSIATLAYIVIIVLFVLSFQGIFQGKPDTMFIPIAMLTLFVFSAALTGFLVFGKPLIWYFDGKKKEALSLVAWTFLFLFIFVIIAFLVMAYFSLIQ